MNALQLDQETPLQLAARFGYKDSVVSLLEDGATVDLQNSFGENVLHICVKESHYNICKQIINVILEKKTKELVEKLINQPNKVSFLLKCRVRINLKNQFNTISVRRNKRSLCSHK